MQRRPVPVSSGGRPGKWAEASLCLDFFGYFFCLRKKVTTYLYNSGSELNEATGWYEMFFRGYDAALGRMLQVDPKADMFSSYSTYNYAGNNPVGFNDPLGDELQINNSGEWEFTFAAEPSDHKTTLGLGGIGSRMVPTSFYGQRYTYAGVSIGRNSGMPADMGMINEMAADIAAGHDVDVAALQQIGLTYGVSGEEASGFINDLSIDGFTLKASGNGGTMMQCYACGEEAGRSADNKIIFYYNTYRAVGGGAQRQRPTFAGGVMYSDITQGLKDMWHASLHFNGEGVKENMGIFTSKGLLVLPNKGNGKAHSIGSAVVLGSIITKDQTSIVYDGSELKILGMVHTHPDSGKMDGHSPYEQSAGDWLFVNGQVGSFVISYSGLYQGQPDLETSKPLGPLNHSTVLKHIISKY